MEELDDELVLEMLERFRAIPNFEDRGIQHYAKCPCGGTITAIRSTYNGHLHASCDKCGFNMME